MSQYSLGDEVPESSVEFPSLSMVASFSLDPVVPILAFWAKTLGQKDDSHLAPYGQIFQQLLDPNSLIGKASGSIVVCVRWSDLASDLNARVKIAKDLGQAVNGLENQASVLILICPDQNSTNENQEADSGLSDELKENPRVTIIDLESVFGLYDVSDRFDSVADTAANIPYTEEGFVALATIICRWNLTVSLNPPIKLFAVDCDNTLWKGVVGEDASDGIEISLAHQELQQDLSKQAKAGRMISLVSKNNEPDVLEVFDRRNEMQISLDDIISHRINWNRKSDNIEDITGELNIGSDSVLFLDDNPIECEEMRTLHPEVMTVQMPIKPEELSLFTPHFWLLDRRKSTAEDVLRLQMYKEQSVREKSAASASSLKDFIDGLNLEIDISAPKESDFARLAQLSQRTNQFNVNLNRVDEASIRASGRNDGTYVIAVSVKDRFGDYGLVGQMRATRSDDKLYADLFMLSCRALGRGVEHKMIAALGALAISIGIEQVALEFKVGPKNTPAAEFLGAVFGVEKPLTDDEVLIADASHLVDVKFEPANKSNATQQRAVPAGKNANSSGVETGKIFENIALRLNSASKILMAIDAETKIARPELGEAFIAPESVVAETITSIWEEVLNISPIGANDRFADLGGQSIHLVRIYSQLKQQLDVDFDLTTLFEFGTIALLARRLENGEVKTKIDWRALQMRQARRSPRQKSMQKLRRGA